MGRHKRTYRVVKHWSVKDADWYYAVYRCTDWGDTTTVYRVACGDQAWAKANAKQLGVRIEREDEVEGEF